jgi:hypothetical protein
MRNPRAPHPATCVGPVTGVFPGELNGRHGGLWAGNVFRYNTAVVNVNTAVIHNAYVKRTVMNNTVVNQASFNGQGGVVAHPTPMQQEAFHEQHFQSTANQFSYQQEASQDRSRWASTNVCRPSTTAMTSVNGRRYDQHGRLSRHSASCHTTAKFM